MELCYSAILHDQTPLVQYCPVPGNFDLFYQRLVCRNEIRPGNLLLIADNFTWRIIRDEDKMTYICVVKDVVSQKLLDKVIDDIKNRFTRICGNQMLGSYPPFAFQTAFEPQLIGAKHALESIYCMEPDFTLPRSPVKIEQLKAPIAMDPVPIEEHIDYAIFANRRRKSEIATSVAIIIVVIAAAYSIAAIFCGGFRLRPLCLK